MAEVLSATEDVVLGILTGMLTALLPPQSPKSFRISAVPVRILYQPFTLPMCY